MTRNGFYYFLTLLIILISGCPAVEIVSKEVLYIGSLAIFSICWVYLPSKITMQDICLYCGFAVICMMHIFIFGGLAANASLGFMVRLAIALLAVRLIPSFNYRYVSVMSVLSAMSLVFFIPSFIGVDTQGLFSALKIPLQLDHFHIGIHNFRVEEDGLIRNAGLFWEPGAFAGYLVLALLFLIRDGHINTVLSRRGYLLVATLLSTQSTTGYLALLILTLLFVYRSGWIKSKAAKIAIPPFLILVAAISIPLLFSSVSFLGEKISAQLESAVMQDSSSRINRFGNFMYDTKWIIDRPILGWSANPETRASVDPEVLDLVEGQGNGLAGFTIKFGLIGLSIFLGLFSLNTYRISGSGLTTVMGVALVCVLLTGEQFLNFPIFLSLMFLLENPMRFTPGIQDQQVS